MKHVAILTSGRTGSNFIAGHFFHKEIYNANEFFDATKLPHYQKVQFLLDNNITLPQSYIDFLSKLYTLSDDETRGWELRKKVYTFDMIKDFSYILKDLEYKYFLHKHTKANSCLLEDLKSDEYIEKIIELSDYIIINYRSSLIKNFLSLKTGIITRDWVKIKTILLNTISAGLNN